MFRNVVSEPEGPCFEVLFHGRRYHVELYFRYEKGDDGKLNLSFPRLITTEIRERFDEFETIPLSNVKIDDKGVIDGNSQSWNAVQNPCEVFLGLIGFQIDSPE